MNYWLKTFDNLMKIDLIPSHLAHIAKMENIVVITNISDWLFVYNQNAIGQVQELLIFRILINIGLNTDPYPSEFNQGTVLVTFTGTGKVIHQLVVFHPYIAYHIPYDQIVRNLLFITVNH